MGWIRDLKDKRIERRIERVAALHKRIEARFAKGGASNYAAIALQYRSLRPWETAAMVHLRHGDTAQVTAVQVLQAARSARWTRWAVIVAALSVPLNVVLTLALARRSGPPATSSVAVAPDGWEVATAFGTIGAALVAGIAAWVAGRSSRHTAHIAELEAGRRADEKRDRSSARVVAFCDPRPHASATSMPYLVIQNLGPSTAFEVTAQVLEPDGKNRTLSALLPNVGPVNLPPGARLEEKADHLKDQFPRGRILVSWREGSPESNGTEGRHNDIEFPWRKFD